MPRQDRTGPLGNGPKSGRGLGKCNPNSQGQSFGTGGGMGRGSGRGMGRNSGGGRFMGNDKDAGWQSNSFFSEVVSELKAVKDRLFHLENKV